MAKRNKDRSDTVRIDIEEDGPAVGSSVPTPAPLPTSQPEEEPADPSHTVVMLRSLVDGSRYQELLQNMYDGVLMTDLKGRMLEANVRAAKLLRTPQSSLLRLTIFDIVHGADTNLLATFTESLKAERHVLLQAYCKRFDGTAFPAEIAVTCLHVTPEGQFCFFIRDVTERKRAEQILRDREQKLSAATKELESRNRELRASEEHLRLSIEELKQKEEALARERDLLQLLMDNIPDRIYFKDNQSRFLRINRAMGGMFGISDPKEASGKTDFDFLGEAQARIFQKEDVQVLKSGVPVVDKVERIRWPDGQHHWSSTTKVPICDEKDRIVGLVGISRDITARMKAEEELKAAQEQLDRAKRLEATALFAGQIAHDFNNLLMPLLVFPDMIAKELPAGSRVREDLKMIESAARQIADINQDLLALARRGNVKPDVLNINAMMEEIAQSFRKSVAPEGMKIECNARAKLPNLKAGGPQIMRVLQNLSQNAVDAMGDTGTLTLTTDNVYLDKPFGNYVRVNPGEYVRSTIADTGSGIPDEIKDKIFDPFFTTKTSRKKRGSGLGLSVVYGIVTDSDGYIDMESEEGKGTRFRLYFPVCRSEIKEKVVPEIKRGTETIFVVDDDPLQIDVLSRILTKLGYTVESTQSGEDAVVQFTERAKGDAAHARFPDLLLLDMIMGNGIDGAETFERIRKINPNQKTMIISGYKESERVTAAQAMGAGQFLRKPVTLEGLSVAVREELDSNPES